MGLYGPQLWGCCSCSAKTFLSQELDSSWWGTWTSQPFLLSWIWHIIVDNFWGIAINLSKHTHTLLSGGWRQFVLKVIFLVASMLIKQYGIKKQVPPNPNHCMIRVYSFSLWLALFWNEGNHGFIDITGRKIFPLAHLCNRHPWLKREITKYQLQVYEHTLVDEVQHLHHVFIQASEGTNQNEKSTYSVPLWLKSSTQIDGWDVGFPLLGFHCWVSSGKSKGIVFTWQVQECGQCTGSVTGCELQHGSLF